MYIFPTNNKIISIRVNTKHIKSLKNQLPDKDEL